MNYKELGDAINKYRVAKGLTLEQVASACNVNRSTVFHWEKGDTKKISYKNRLTLIDRLNIPPAYFIVDPEHESETNMKNEILTTVRNRIFREISTIESRETLEMILNIVVAIKKQEK